MLFVDFGNTSIKYRLSEADETKRAGDVDVLLSELQGSDCKFVFVSDVSGHAEKLRNYCIHRQIKLFDIKVEQDFFDLHLIYRDVSKLGVDRWLNMLGAKAHFPETDLIIVDIGTALKVEHLNSHGTQKGGVIAPGIAMGRKSLNRGTALLPEVSFSFDGRLGTDTESSIQYGLIMSAVSLVERSVSDSFPNAKVLLTGGDAEKISPHLSIEFEYVPDLLFKGMYKYSEIFKASRKHI